MKTVFIFAIAGMAVARLSAADVDWSKLPPASTQTDVTFDKDIQPLFKTSCVHCHGEEHPRAQLRLDTLDGVLKGSKEGAVVTAGDSANSQLVKAISQLDPKIAMPPKPRARRSPQGTNAPAMPPSEAGGPPPNGEGDHGPGGPDGQRPRNFGPPPKPLTAEQVGLVRAWIDQGAK